MASFVVSWLKRTCKPSATDKIYTGMLSSFLPLRLKGTEFQEQTKRSDWVIGSMEKLLKDSIDSIAFLIYFGSK